MSFMMKYKGKFCKFDIDGAYRPSTEFLVAKAALGFTMFVCLLVCLFVSLFVR